MEEKHRKNLEYLIVFVSILLLLIVMQLTNIAERWNYVIYDFLQRSSELTKSNDIVIVDIDNASLQRLGAWPWKRSIHADLLTRLNRVTPQSVTFDILFIENDSQGENEDILFSRAIQRSGKVVLPVLHLQNENINNKMMLQYPVLTLKNQVAQLAHVDAEIDSDGLIRRSFLKAGLGESKFSTLGLAALEVAKQKKFRDLPGLKNEKTAFIQNDDWVRDNQTLFSFANAINSFNTYSYVEVLENDSVLKKLAGKIIFIGVTASGISKNLPIANSVNHTPISSIYYHASIANALLTNNSITILPRYIIFVTTSSLLIVLMLIYSFCRPGITLIAVFMFASLIFIGCFVLLNKFLFWLPPVEIIISILISYPLISWINLKLITKQLSKEKEQAEVTLNSIADGVITLDQYENILYMNPVAEALTGVSLRHALKRSLHSVFNIIDQHTGKKVTQDLLVNLQNKMGSLAHDGYVLKDVNGHEYIIRATVGRIQHSALNGHGAVLAFNDITETVNLIDHMSHQVTHDALTGLPNRALLMESLIHSLAIADQKQYQVALLFVDIDKFKNINDGFGHEIGDQLLRKIAEQLKISVRDEGIIARLGGDEFVIVLDQVSKTANVVLITQKILRQLSCPIKLLNQEFLVTCSIGISFFPKDAKNAETLMKNADIAMYSAKEKGRNNFQLFSQNMNEVVQHRLKLEKELRLAFEENNLELYYQPQVDTRENKIIGVEALIRWNHHKLGFISPASFIPLAEDTGLIIPIGEWVLKTACAQIKSWKHLIDDDFTLAVNLSPRQFLGQDVLSMLTEVLTLKNIAAKHLKLEITEGLFIAKETNIDSTLAHFRQMGGSVSIDDFGTGYSSLSYLNRFPVDQIKIDRHFIQEITTNARGCSLTKAIISMANDMNLDVIAEGVENEAQLKMLKNLNCFNVQGFYFSPAVDANTITEFLKSKTPFSEIH